MSAALYAVLFIVSKLVPGLPNFAVLYLPVVLLGVFPIWFSCNGLVGSMIGAYIGGVYAEAPAVQHCPSGTGHDVHYLLCKLASHTQIGR